jgi:hypothetical protein
MLVPAKIACPRRAKAEIVDPLLWNFDIRFAPRRDILNSGATHPKDALLFRRGTQPRR